MRFCWGTIHGVTEGEIYPNAPVVLAALEVRHPTADVLSQAQQRKFKQLLGKDVPILRTAQLANIEAMFAPGAPAGPPTVRVEKFPKYFSRDNTVAVSVREASIVVETTRYVGWSQFRELVTTALRARQDVGDIDGVERVGLRYIDEIRVPDQADAEWEAWVDTALLGPVPLGEKLGLSATEWQGVTVFSSGSDRLLVLRYGPRVGYAVQPGTDLKRPTPNPGPFFLADIDSFWTPSQELPEFDASRLVETADELHAPVRRLFESLITDQLREKVLRHAN
jgi:uncharacterized protein (TIGR04255 family)